MHWRNDFIHYLVVKPGQISSVMQWGCLRINEMGFADGCRDKRAKILYVTLSHGAICYNKFDLSPHVIWSLHLLHFLNYLPLVSQEFNNPTRIGIIKEFQNYSSVTANNIMGSPPSQGFYCVTYILSSSVIQMKYHCVGGEDITIFHIILNHWKKCLMTKKKSCTQVSVQINHFLQGRPIDSNFVMYRIFLIAP